MINRRITRSTIRSSVDVGKNEINEVKKPEKKKNAKKGKTERKVEKKSESPTKRLETEPEIKNRSKTGGGALKGRVEEFDSLKEWISESIENKKAVSIYISGQPGTGKTATTKRVCDSFNLKQLECCYINCASISTKTALLSAIFKSQEFEGKASQENFEKKIRQMRTSLVLVLDEIDHLASGKNSTLYSAFNWPYSLSYKIIIIGIANSIDLTERLLPKLMLSEPPKRLVFEPYSKENIVEILTDKMEEDDTDMDKKAVELCARKVAAMSGDLRTALQVFKQTKHRTFTKVKMEEDGSPVPKKNICREVLGVINSVYSSPLARAKLPHQPRILLAVCLVLSSSKKAPFNRNMLMDAYAKACTAIHAPQMDDDDFLAAFRSLESQSFVKQLNNGNLMLQVDSATAKAAISDNSMLDQIGLLKI